jgi:excisionase family DNA binding protein
MSRLLTTKELTEILKVHRATIFRWREELGLPYKKISSRAIRFDLDEVKEWMEKQEILNK